MFKDRVEAGRLLGERLLVYKGKDIVVFAIPRGGVVVAYEVATMLDCPLDLIVPRKIGAPLQPELAIGAVAQDGTIVLNHELVETLGISESYIHEEAKRQIQEIERRMRKYRGEKRPYPTLKDKIVILVDDGIATGATVRAAILSLRKQGLASVIIAVPVGSSDTVESLGKEADEVVCLELPEDFYAIGQFYEEFPQMSDEEVTTLMKRRAEELEAETSRR